MVTTPWKNRVVVLTGAGSGIGRALAVSLASRGARLAISDVNEAGLHDTLEQCEAAGSEQVHMYTLDVSDREAVAAHADEVVEAFGKVNAIINNAGVSLTAMATEQNFDDIDWVLRTNLFGVLYGCQLFLPHLIASGDGVIINISSIFGVIGVPGQSVYNASKFGVRGYTEALAIEMAEHPVAVHCVHPGGVQTNIVRNSRVANNWSRSSLAKRFDRVARTTPEDAAELILRRADKGQIRILIGRDAHALYAMSRLFGSGYCRLIQRQSKRLYPK
jgi:hypothetical protein